MYSTLSALLSSLFVAWTVWINTNQKQNTFGIAHRNTIYNFFFQNRSLVGLNRLERMNSIHMDARSAAGRALAWKTGKPAILNDAWWLSSWKKHIAVVVAEWKGLPAHATHYPRCQRTAVHNSITHKHTRTQSLHTTYCYNTFCIVTIWLRCLFFYLLLHLLVLFLLSHSLPLQTPQSSNNKYNKEKGRFACAVVLAVTQYRQSTKWRWWELDGGNGYTWNGKTGRCDPINYVDFATKRWQLKKRSFFRSRSWLTVHLGWRYWKSLYFIFFIN